MGEGILSDYARGLRDAAAMLDVDRQTLRLHAGELSAQEMRAILAVLGWKRREILARAKATPGASGLLDRPAPGMKEIRS